MKHSTYWIELNKCFSTPNRMTSGEWQIKNHYQLLQYISINCLCICIMHQTIFTMHCWHVICYVKLWKVQLCLRWMNVFVKYLIKSVIWMNMKCKSGYGISCWKNALSQVGEIQGISTAFASKCHEKNIWNLIFLLKRYKKSLVNNKLIINWVKLTWFV